MEKILVKNEQKEILDLCKVTPVKVEKEDKLMFVELGRDMFKDNKYILDKYFRNENLQSCFYANLLAFRNIPGITIYEIHRQLKKDFGKSVSLSGYKYDPEHYRFACCYLQEEYEEDLFKNKSKEEELAEIEAERRARIEPIDFDAMESLYAVLFKALKGRLIMIFNLENIPGIINNALDCYYKGVSCGASNAAMHAKIAEIRQMLEDNEVIEWLKTNPTDLCFDKNMYVETYQKVLRQITGIRNDSEENELRNYVYDVIHNEEDLWEEDILSNSLFDNFISYDDRLIGYDFDKEEYQISEAYDDEDAEYLD